MLIFIKKTKRNRTKDWLTEFGKDEQEHGKRRDNGDNATGKWTGEEIFIDFRVGV